MDNGDLQNNQNNLHGGSENRLSVESLPLIDTRLLSQSELFALAHCSSLSPFSSSSFATSSGGYDDWTPVIDPSVFNESAGSRKQTFLRVRLARHPQPPEPSLLQHQRNESSREEQLLLRSLFNVDSVQDNEPEVEDNEGQIHNNSYVYQRTNLDSVQNVLIEGSSGNEIKRKRGRPRKIRNPSEETEGLHLAGEVSVYKTGSNSQLESRLRGSGISMDLNPEKRKRGRPPKNRDGFNQHAVNCKREDKDELMNLENKEGTMVDLSALDKDELVNLENKEGTMVDLSPLEKDELVNLENKEGTMVDLSPLEKDELVNLENKEGTMVDLSALANASEDPYGEELRRITVGLKTKEDFLGFLEQLNGKWVNTGKKKKLVKASDYGEYLPRGWKLVLCIKKKGSYVWLACCSYVSPDGQQYDTFKEVSMYLQSLHESPTKNMLNILQFDNKTLGQQPVMANEALLSNSDSMNLPVETNQNHENGRPGSEVVEEAKNAEIGDVADQVKTSLVEKDDNADFLNGKDGDYYMKKKDGNIENLVGLSNSEAQNGEKMKKDMLTVKEELEQNISSGSSSGSN